MGEQLLGALVDVWIVVADGADPAGCQKGSLMPTPTVPLHVAEPLPEAGEGRVTIMTCVGKACVWLEVFVNMSPTGFSMLAKPPLLTSSRIDMVA